jgi:branched-chain amino acid transport system substrate-binding protein
MGRKMSTLKTLGLLGLLGAASAVLPGQASGQEVIKFGLISSFSGAAASFGEVEAVSVEIAINDINAAGGVKVGDKTYKMQLTKYDHAYDPAKAVTVARQAVQQDGVKFVEVLGGGIIPAVQTVTEPAKVLLFGQGGGSHWLGKNKPFTFQPFYSIGGNAVAVYEYIRQTYPDAKKIALVYPDDDMGDSVASEALLGAKEFGLVAEKAFVGRSMTDFYPLFASLLRDPPDFIDVDGMPGPQYAALAKQARENGFKGHFIFSSTLDANAFAKLNANDTIVGSLVAPAWTVWPTEAGKRWLAEVDRRLPGNRQMWTGRSYDNLMLLKAAIEKAGSLDTTKVRDALTEVTAIGVSGSVRYVAAPGADYGARHLRTSIPVGEVIKTADGKLDIKKVWEKQ